MQVQLTGDANDAVHSALFMCYSTMVMKKHFSPRAQSQQMQGLGMGPGPMELGN